MAFLLLVPGISLAEWSDGDTFREANYMAFHIADWGQTRNIANNPDKYHERNPLLGKHPSIKRVDTHFVVGALVHIGVAYILPRTTREAFQYVTTGFEAAVVFNNNRVGLRVDF